MIESLLRSLIRRYYSDLDRDDKLDLMQEARIKILMRWDWIHEIPPDRVAARMRVVALNRMRDVNTKDRIRKAHEFTSPHLCGW